MAISKVLAFAFLNPRACPDNIRCPVEETGINSVIPSIIPNRIALIKSDIIELYRGGEKISMFKTKNFGV